MTSPNALHADQHHFKNLTNDQVTRLQTMMTFAKTSMDHAIKRLRPIMSPSVGTYPAERWNRENYHCWWGKFDAKKTPQTAQLCIARYETAKGKLNTSMLRFKLRDGNRWSSVAPYRTWRIYLGAGFFNMRSLDALNTLIHEVFHLVGLVDLRYKRDASVTLAQCTPLLARGNPDNYAFFAIDCYRNYMGKLPVDDPDCKLARQDHGALKLPGT